jgi:hypothetical protein
LYPGRQKDTIVQQQARVDIARTANLAVRNDKWLSIPLTLTKFLQNEAIT